MHQHFCVQLNAELDQKGHSGLVSNTDPGSRLGGGSKEPGPVAGASGPITPVGSC